MDSIISRLRQGEDTPEFESSVREALNVALNSIEVSRLNNFTGAVGE